MNPIARLKAKLTLDVAIKQANEAHKRHCERYYVMPNLDGKLVVMTKFDLKYFKRKGYVGKQSHVLDLIRECFYHTPYRNGDGILPPDVAVMKRRQYYAWYDAVRKQVAHKRKQIRRAKIKKFYNKILQLLHIA